MAADMADLSAIFRWFHMAGRRIPALHSHACSALSKCSLNVIGYMFGRGSCRLILDPYVTLDVVALVQ